MNWIMQVLLAWRMPYRCRRCGKPFESPLRLIDHQHDHWLTERGQL